MNDNASDIAARLAATAAGSHVPTMPPPEAPPLVSDPARTVPPIQRFTINLPKAQHRFIRQFALSADTDVSTIVRLLFDRIEHDAAFAEEIRVQLARRE